ncbi:MAG: hypothetical protein IPM29_04535 [Planctomycetes bacterium]|nr:hypothetical protein [Planctomycetota bacterium]
MTRIPSVAAPASPPGTQDTGELSRFARIAMDHALLGAPDAAFLEALRRNADSPWPEVARAAQMLAASLRPAVSTSDRAVLEDILADAGTDAVAPRETCADLCRLARRLHADGAEDAEAVRRLAAATCIALEQVDVISDHDVPVVLSGAVQLDPEALARCWSVAATPGRAARRIAEKLLASGPGRPRPEWTQACGASLLALEVHRRLAARVRAARRITGRFVALFLGVAILALVVGCAFTGRSSSPPGLDAAPPAIDVWSAGPPTMARGDADAAVGDTQLVATPGPADDPEEPVDPELPLGALPDSSVLPPAVARELGDRRVIVVVPGTGPGLEELETRLIEFMVGAAPENVTEFVPYTCCASSECLDPLRLLDPRALPILPRMQRDGLLVAAELVLLARPLEIGTSPAVTTLSVSLVRLGAADQPAVPPAQLWRGILTFRVRHALELTEPGGLGADPRSVRSEVRRRILADLLVAQARPGVDDYLDAACILLDGAMPDSDPWLRARDILRRCYHQHQDPLLIRLRIGVEDLATRKALHHRHPEILADPEIGVFVDDNVDKDPEARRQILLRWVAEHLARAD